MLVHTVLLRLRPDASETALLALSDRLRVLSDAVAGPDSCVVGPNSSEEPFSQGYEFGFALTLPDRSALDAYHVNPAHLGLSLAIRDLASEILVFDLAS